MVERSIEYIFVKSELGAGTWGASLGIEAVQLAASRRDSDIFEKFPTHWIEDESKDEDMPPFAHNIPKFPHLYNQIAGEIGRVVLDEGFPVIIAGDHANAGGTIAGLRMAYPEKRLGVIWIDAHGDLHTPYTTPSGNLHGMPLGMSLGLGKTPTSKNVLDPETAEYWDKLMRFGDIYPKLDARDLVMVGIRDLEEEEWDIIRRMHIRHYAPEKVHELGIATLAREVLDYLRDCDMLYVSFDVDFMDINIVHGTGTPTPDGLTVGQSRQLLRHFWKSPKLVALEICEVNPLLDTQNKTAEIVCDIIESILDEE